MLLVLQKYLQIKVKKILVYLQVSVIHVNQYIWMCPCTYILGLESLGKVILLKQNLPRAQITSNFYSTLE